MSRYYHFTLIMLVGLVVGPSGCGSRQPASSRTNAAPEQESGRVDPQQKQRATEAKDALFAQLSGRLMEVMGSEGPAAAIRVCSQEASQIATQVGAEQGVAIGRTAIRLRNENNVAPDWASPMIQQAPVQAQFVARQDGHLGALFPIKLKALCVVCHGPSDTMSEDVKAELQQRYPLDQATGFQEGDLRGWFWVDVPPLTTDRSGSAS